MKLRETPAPWRQGFALYRRRTPKPDVLIPFIPAGTFKMILYCHIKAIFSGFRIQLRLKELMMVFFPPFISFFQDLKPRFVYFIVSNIPVIITKISLFTLIFCKKTFSDQLLQINKIRISSKCRKRLIRRIPKTRRAQWKDLPEALSAFL